MDEDEYKAQTEVDIPETDQEPEPDEVQDSGGADPIDGEQDVEEGLTADSCLMTGEPVANGKQSDSGCKKDDSRFNLDVYVRGHRNSAVKKLRGDARRFCIYLCALLTLIAVVSSVILLLFYMFYSHPSRDVFATTPYGRIKGHRIPSPQGAMVEEYLGIPFAKPPVGPLRYHDPVPYGNYTGGEYTADSIQNSCVLPLDTTFGDFAGSNMWNPDNPTKEDCLFLNVWVPTPRKKNRSVMVWIYGGGFFSGSTALWVYDGKALSAFGDVIVASLNYRVGTFGYLSTGDGRITGNFGMKDQVLALTWIKENIASFGGDPESITLFGESSGASSAGLHMMSPQSQDLFNRAIFESGSPDSHWSFMTREQARERSRLFFEAVNCPDDDYVLDCLRQLDATTILNNEWVDGNFMVFPWTPTIDNDFIDVSPHEFLKLVLLGENSAFSMKHKEAILGVNSDEGTYWILYALGVLSKDHESLVTREQFISAIDTLDWDLSDETRREIVQRYAPANMSDTAAHRDQLDKVCGDRSFTCPTRELATVLAHQGITTYFYYLTHRASNEPWPPWMGVIHGAEIQWVFGMPLNKTRKYSTEEIQLSKDIMSYWVNFAKYGNPNSGMLPNWPEFTTDNHQYIEIASHDKFIVRSGLRDEYCEFWDDVKDRIATGVNV